MIAWETIIPDLFHACPYFGSVTSIFQAPRSLQLLFPIGRYRAKYATFALDSNRKKVNIYKLFIEFEMN